MQVLPISHINFFGSKSRTANVIANKITKVSFDAPIPKPETVKANYFPFGANFEPVKVEKSEINNKIQRYPYYSDGALAEEYPRVSPL